MWIDNWHPSSPSPFTFCTHPSSLSYIFQPYSPSSQSTVQDPHWSLHTNFFFLCKPSAWLYVSSWRITLSRPWSPRLGSHQAGFQRLSKRVIPKRFEKLSSVDSHLQNSSNDQTNSLPRLEVVSWCFKWRPMLLAKVPVRGLQNTFTNPRLHQTFRRPEWWLQLEKIDFGQGEGRNCYSANKGSKVVTFRPRKWQYTLSSLVRNSWLLLFPHINDFLSLFATSWLICLRQCSCQCRCRWTWFRSLSSWTWTMLWLQNSSHWYQE